MKIMVLHLLESLIGPRLRFPGLWGRPGPKPWGRVRKSRRGEIWGPVLGLIRWRTGPRDGSEQNDTAPFDSPHPLAIWNKKKLIHINGQASLAFWLILGTNMTLIPKIAPRSNGLSLIQASCYFWTFGFPESSCMRWCSA